MHRCDNPKCVNPAHLKLGTQKENVLDCYNKGRQRKPRPYKLGLDAGDKMRSLVAKGLSQRKIAAQLGVTQSRVCQVLKETLEKQK